MREIKQKHERELDEVRKKNQFLMQNIQEMKSQVNLYSTENQRSELRTWWDTPCQQSIPMDANNPQYYNLMNKGVDHKTMT